MIGTVCVLALLALIDGACAGFRSSVGRTGLVRHRAADLRAAVHGVVLVVALLLPATAIAAGAVAAGASARDFAAAGDWMLRILIPYAAAVLLALLAYGVLGWRQKYLAMALVLGPFTLVRPAVAVAAAVVGCITAGNGLISLAIGLSVGAVLAVEPVLDRWWSRAEA